MGGWLDRRREQRVMRLLDKYARARMDNLVGNNPPLSPRHEAFAKQLVTLGPSALGSKRSEVRAIGERLNREGGMSLMRAVLHRAEALSVQQGSYHQQSAYSILRKIESAWSGIGDWLG